MIGENIRYTYGVQPQPEDRNIRRENLTTGLIRWLTLSEAVEELASMTSAREYDSRSEIVVALCEGKTITAGVWAYCWRSEGR